MEDLVLGNVEAACQHQHLKETRDILVKASKRFAGVLKNYGERTITIRGIKFKFIHPAAYSDTYIIDACNVFRLKQEDQTGPSYRKLLEYLNDINSRSFGAKAVCEYGDIHVISQGYLPEKRSERTDAKLFKRCLEAMTSVMENLEGVLGGYK